MEPKKKNSQKESEFEECCSRSVSEMTLKKRGSEVHSLVTWCSCWRTRAGGGRTACFPAVLLKLRSLQADAVHSELCSRCSPLIPSHRCHHSPISIPLLTFKGWVRSTPPLDSCLLRGCRKKPFKLRKWTHVRVLAEAERRRSSNLIDESPKNVQ